MDYLEVELSDIEVANRLAGEVLGRSLDELPPQTRRLLELLDRMVAEAAERDDVERGQVRFTRRQVRRETGWRDTQLRLHLGRLADMEYLLIHQGGRGRSFVYELLYEAEGRGSGALLARPDRRREAPEAGLKRTAAYDPHLAGSGANLAGPAAENAPPSRPQRGEVAGGARGQKEATATGVSGDSSPQSSENAHLEGRANPGRSRTLSLPFAARAGGEA